MNWYIWFMLIATVVGLVAFAILHKQDGVVQKVKVYGNKYYVKTLVYVEGKVVDEGWYDEIETDEDYKRIKESRKEQAEDFYNTLTFKK